jgi:hypothetical protein
MSTFIKSLKKGTYRQQKSALEKLKEYKETLYFYEINKQEVDNITRFLKVKKKTTVYDKKMQLIKL